jgi:hypothetical protein
MKNANIGIINLIISNKLKDSYFSNTLIEESKKIAFNFFNIIKNSPILLLEFKVFNNIENKYIDNDIIATRYIDNNIKLFEVYTLVEIEKEREKLNMFLNESTLLNLNNENIKKVALYEAIDQLIQESLNDYDKIDVDVIHESFTLILNYIKEPKKISKNILVENINLINEEVIEIAVNKFNKKYEILIEDDKNLFQKLIKSNDDEKQELLETYKNETLTILDGLNKDNIKDSITKAIQKIKEMVFIQKNVDDDIISLYELKKELL